jgi:hypothetical protein
MRVVVLNASHCVVVLPVPHLPHMMLYPHLFITPRPPFPFPVIHLNVSLPPFVLPSELIYINIVLFGVLYFFP